LSTEKTFFERVYEVVRKIPFGRVTSYGAIAQYLGTSATSRSVGWAMNASHNDDTIPAHRVVNRYGLLTGKHHFGGSNIMKNLLENEGIKIKENQVKNFNYHFWNPNIELESL